MGQGDCRRHALQAAAADRNGLNRPLCRDQDRGGVGSGMVVRPTARSAGAGVGRMRPISSRGVAAARVPIRLGQIEPQWTGTATTGDAWQDGQPSFIPRRMLGPDAMVEAVACRGDPKPQPLAASASVRMAVSRKRRQRPMIRLIAWKRDRRRLR